MKPWKHAEFWFCLFCLSLGTASYLNGGGFTPRIEIPTTPPEVVNNGNKFWKDEETIAIAESYGLKGTAAYLVQNRGGAKFSVIAFPNGFVQMRGSVKENRDLLETIRIGVLEAKAKK